MAALRRRPLSPALHTGGTAPMTYDLLYLFGGLALFGAAALAVAAADWL
jgi:hypothetical protein